MEHIETIGPHTARRIVQGVWLYDGIKEMPVQIFAINYDYHYEMNKEEGVLDANEVPELNTDGEQYMVCWHDSSFFSHAAASAPGGLTMEEAKKSAERVVKQEIQWGEPMTNRFQ